MKLHSLRQRRAILVLGVLTIAGLITGGLTVRQVERLASRRARGNKEKAETQVDPNVREALEELQRHLGTKIFLRERTKIRPGQLVLEYYDDNQLMGLYDRLMK